MIDIDLVKLVVAGVAVVPPAVVAAAVAAVVAAVAVAAVVGADPNPGLGIGVVLCDRD